MKNKLITIAIVVLIIWSLYFEYQMSGVVAPPHLLALVIALVIMIIKDYRKQSK